MLLNTWLLLFSFFLFLIIIRKINNLNKPFNEKIFIEKYLNYNKLKKKINIKNIKKNIPLITSYYLGIK